MQGANGEALQRADGGAVFRTMLFPKASARMTDIWRVVGLRGTGSDSYSVDELFVPESHTVLRDPANRPREPGLLYRFSSSNLYSSGFAGVALGIARAALDAFIELARDKIPRGGRRTLRDNNVVQSQVAKAEARLEASRAFLLGSLDDIWREVGCTGALSLSTTRQSGSLRPGPSIRRPPSSTPPITPPGPRRSSRTTRSSGGFAMSTP